MPRYPMPTRHHSARAAAMLWLLDKILTPVAWFMDNVMLRGLNAFIGLLDKALAAIDGMRPGMAMLANFMDFTIAKLGEGIGFDLAGTGNASPEGMATRAVARRWRTSLRRVPRRDA